MSIPVPVPTHPFATLGNTEGVPLDLMRPMIGAGDELRMGTLTLNNPAGSLSEAVAISGFVPITPATHDYLHIDIPGARFSLSIDEFIDIEEAEVGDVLSTAADPATAKSAINPVNGETLLVGRTTNNGVLIQAGTHAPGSTRVAYNLHVESYDAGVLHRRISPFQDHATRQVILQRHSAVTPPAPTGTEVSFDGQRPILAEDSEWAPIDLQISGTDPLWLATITFQYHFTLTRWIRVGNWVVYPGASTFRIQYASSSSGPWVNADPGDSELWVRYRLADGTWSAHQVRGLSSSTRQWRELEVKSLTSGFTSSDARIPGLNLHATEWLSIAHQPDNNPSQSGIQGNIVSIEIPAQLLRGTDPSNAGLQRNSILFMFNQITGGTWVIGDEAFPNDTAYNDWRNAATTTEQRGHINFYGTAENDNMVSNARILRGHSANLGVFVFRSM